jgi:hypothetical protein
MAMRYHSSIPHGRHGEVTRRRVALLDVVFEDLRARYRMVARDVLGTASLVVTHCRKQCVQVDGFHPADWIQPADVMIPVLKRCRLR